MPKDPIWKKKLATNHDMLQFLIEHKPTWYGYPNRAFNYCNTNYAVLALIIEKVSGQTYPEYLKNNIFNPLGMTNSFVFTVADSINYKPSYQPNNRPYNLEPMDVVYGDKGIYSTVRDLLLWDKALYTNRIISQSTYEEAIKPSSFERPGTHNYGMGFRLMMLPNSKVVFHNGWWHGNNNVFTRLVDDTATIIILGNKFNKAIYSGMKIGTIFKHSTKTEVENPVDGPQ
jgi:CubicO group peptidase (beta-lactamase class C family)